MYIQVYSRLNALELSVSYSTVITLIDNLGKDHDKEVYNWRDDMAALLTNGNSVMSLPSCQIAYTVE